MNAEEHRALRELLGAFVLGHLTESEKLAVQAHLDGCPECRAEVDELAPLVGALNNVDPDRVLAPTQPPPMLADRVLETIRSEQRGRNRMAVVRRVGAGLLAAAVLVGVFLLGTAQTPTAPPVVAMAVHLNAAGVQADAGLVKHTWGTELKLKATGLVDGDAYTVTFIRNDGSRVPGGTFIGTGDNTLNCSLNGALPLDQTVEVMVTDASGTVILDAEPV